MIVFKSIIKLADTQLASSRDAEQKKYDFQLNKYFYFSFRFLFICWTTLLNCKKFNLQSNVTTEQMKKKLSGYPASFSCNCKLCSVEQNWKFVALI